MSRQRELVGRTRPGRPVRDRTAVEPLVGDPAGGPVGLLDRPLTDPGTPRVPRPRGADPTDTGARTTGRDTARDTDTDLPIVRVLQATPAGDGRRDTGPAGTAAGASGPARRRSLPRPPGRRAPLLLVALVVGAVIAALPGGIGSRAAAPAPVAAAGDYGLSAEDANFAGGMDDVSARREITAAEAAARLDALAASRAEREPDFVLPTEGRMSTCFCMRWGTMHWGVDLAAPLGTPILAAADGVVLRSGPASGYGNAIYIQDADGNVEIYGHMRYLYVEAGDVVSAGDLIAKVGSEGQSTGPHLHFEIHLGSMTGRPTDPQEWLAERGIEIG
ncbi:M23 family metallopeptidase [Modestobacter sp. Leaf380]|uniref:M23 family metallopeptidase n=1 Tax=Modestobacter sp. Leaf380 TaxID=1736356 RepID=UPI001F1DFBA1|nr:M23 family metallopeptidase [Modestobacter sp. Leaf380]